MATGAAGPHPDDGSDPRFEESSYEFDPRDVRIRQDGEYDIVELPGSVPDVDRSRLGQPQLPVIIKWFAIPKDSKVASVEVQAAEWTELPGRLLPPPIGWEDDDDQDRDSDYYASDGPFPPLQGFACRSTEHRGYYLAQMVVYPVRWDPLTGTAELARDVRVSVRTQPLSGDEARSVPRVRRPEGADPHGETRRFLLGMVENRSEMERLYPWTERGTRMEQEHRVVESTPYGAVPTTWPSTEGPTVERVIIYDNQTLSGEPIGNVGTHAVDYALFCLYHEGQLTAPVKLSDILAQYGAGYGTSADVPEILRQFALDCYELWRTSSILLVGDLDVIPARRFGGPTSTDAISRMDPPSDVYITTFGENEDHDVIFADWNADDNTWEWENQADPGVVPEFDSQPGITVGRLPARTADDAEAMFRKLMEYRQPDKFGKVAPPGSYYGSFLGVAGMTLTSAWVGSGFSYVEDVIDEVDSASEGAVAIHRLYADPPHDEIDCSGTPVPCYPTLGDSIGARWQTGDEIWTGTGLFDNVNEGFHLVFHMEHSDTDRWGRPTKFAPFEQPCLSGSAAWRDACEALVSYSSVEPLTLATVRSLTNGLISYGGGSTPRYSIMASHGSWTNALDRATIAEELLATPDGGAVAYLGKIQSANPARDAVVEFFGNLVKTTGAPPNIGAAAAWGAAGGTNQSYVGFARRATIRPLLGDPGMRVWGAAPEPLEVVLPNAVGLGPQTISVTVRGADSLDPVGGAIVTAQQDSVAWATAVTNASGVAVFEAFTVRRDTNIRINAAHRNYYSGVDTLDVAPASPYLTYDHHVLDDDAPGGDGDGILEAGEVASLRVIWRNEGSVTATTPVLSLRPSPSVEFHLQINGEYRPAEVYIGSKSATPPNTVTESFRLPVTWEGVSVHGEPNAVSLEENFKVWRKHDTGEYVVSARSASAQTDSTFTGMLRTDGFFSGVTMTGESGVDSYFASADSIWFQFHGDASADNLTFRAEAVDWVTVTADATGLVLGVAAGDTIGRNFDVELTGEVPDRTVLPFTATAKQNGTVYAHGELAFEVHAPAMELWALDDVATTASGCGVARSFFPTLWNSGTAEADSVIVRARVVSGSATVIDSLASFGRLDPDLATIVADSIVVCAADSASLANSILDLDLQVLLRNEENQWYDPGEVGGGGGGAEPPVTDAGEFVAEPRGRGIQLRWDPTETVHGEPVTRYLVYVETESGPSSFYPVGEVFGATRLEVLDIAGERLEPFDENGDPIEYRFAVRACAGGRCALPSALSITNQPNFTQHEGWPKTVPSGLTTAPLTVDLDGREAVFVAGREIYAWWLDDGTPVAGTVEGEPDGFFYDPELPLEASTVFAEKLVELPLFDEGERTGTAIVGNVIRDAVYAVEAVGPDGNGNYEAAEIWSKQIRGWLAAPMVLQLNSPELGSEYQVAIAGRTDTLYVWMDDGEPYLSNYTTNPGAYAYFGAGGPSHRTLAEWYYPYPLHEAVEHYIVQSMKDGTLVQWDTPSRSSSSLASARWQVNAEDGAAGFLLSAPSVGDIDGDGVAEVIYTDQTPTDSTGSPACSLEACGEVFVHDGSDGSLEYYSVSDEWLFWANGSGEPGVRPILSDLDPENQGEEAVVGGWEYVSSSDYGTEYFLLPLREEHNSQFGDLEPIASRVPATTGLRFGSSGGTFLRHEGVSGDLGDGGDLEILYPTVHGEVVGVEWRNPGSPLPDSVGVKHGWPLWIGDEPLTPCLVAGEEGGVLIASRDKRLHFLRVPGTSWPEDAWPQYGRNSRNTASHVPPAFSPREEHDGDLITLRVAPVPSRGAQRIEFGLSRAGTVDLAVYDVAGRRVRVLLDGTLLEPGVHGVNWDGRDDRGHRVASGVYFHRIQGPDGKQIVRTVVRR